jgi:hypothetical protein
MNRPHECMRNLLSNLVPPQLLHCPHRSEKQAMTSSKYNSGDLGVVGFLQAERSIRTTGHADVKCRFAIRYGCSQV